MLSPIIISIEGNIGAGKTTIVKELYKRFQDRKDIIFVKEPVDIWETIKDDDGETILQKFYKNPSKYAFQFQVMALTTRISLLRDTIRENPHCKVIISERCVNSDKEIFAKMLHDDNLINNLDYKIYRLMSDEHSKEFPIKGHIYINSDAEICYNRVQKRSRNGESGIELEYLLKCKKYHDVWLSNFDNWDCNNNTISTTILNLNTNNDATYNIEDTNDPGNIWINEIDKYIHHQINTFTPDFMNIDVLAPNVIPPPPNTPCVSISPSSSGSTD